MVPRDGHGPVPVSPADGRGRLDLPHLGHVAHGLPGAERAAPSPLRWSRRSPRAGRWRRARRRASPASPCRRAGSRARLETALGERPALAASSSLTDTSISGLTSERSLWTLVMSSFFSSSSTTVSEARLSFVLVAAGYGDLDPARRRPLLQDLHLEALAVEVAPLPGQPAESLLHVGVLRHDDEGLRLVPGAQGRVRVEVVLAADGELVALDPAVFVQEVLEGPQLLAGLVYGGPRRELDGRLQEPLLARREEADREERYGREPARRTPGAPGAGPPAGA